MKVAQMYVRTKNIGQILYCIKLMSISQIKSKIVFVKTMYALQVPLYRIKNTFPCKYFEINHFKRKNYTNNK